MDIVLCLIMFAVANIVLSDFMRRGIEYLYVLHSDLIIAPWECSGKPHHKRFLILYILNFGWGLFLLKQNIMPMDFLWQWIIILLLNMVIVTDYEQRLIFDRILLVIAIVAVLSGGGFDSSLLNRVGGATVGGGVMVLLAVLMRGTLGGGDIKLVIVLGLWQGLDHIGAILINGFLLGGLAALLLLFTGLKKRTDYFAYGPYFIFGAWINVFLK